MRECYSQVTVHVNVMFCGHVPVARVPAIFDYYALIYCQEFQSCNVLRDLE